MRYYLCTKRHVASGFEVIDMIDVDDPDDIVVMQVLDSHKQLSGERTHDGDGNLLVRPEETI